MIKNMAASLLIALNSTVTPAQDCTQLEVQVKECEAILDMTGPLIKAQGRKITLLEAQIESLNTQRAELEIQLNAARAPWYERPEFVVPATVISVLLIQKGLSK